MASGAETESVQIVVPVYNEGENVRRLYASLLSEGIAFDTLEFIYDFDEDTTIPFVAELRSADERVSAVRNDFGRGILNALRFSFSRAKPGPVLVLMGDNSDKISVIPEMIEHWKGGATIVCPSRYMKGGEQRGGGVLKSGLSRLAGSSLSLFGFPTADPTNNFKLYDGTWLRCQEIESTGGFEVALELCYKAFLEGRRIVEIPTVWYDRTRGSSRFRLWAWLLRYLRWYLHIVWALAMRKLSLIGRKSDEDI